MAKEKIRTQKKRIAISILVLLVTFFFIVFSINGSLGAQNKNDTLKNITKIVDSFKTSEADYADVHDNQCSENQSVGLQTIVNCGAGGELFFRDKVSNLYSHLKDLDARLLEDGYERLFMIDQSSEDFVKGLNGEKENAIFTYTDKKNFRVVVRLSYFISATQTNDLAIRDMIDRQILKPVKTGEVIYGITVSANYYSCTGVSIEPCLFVPGDIK